MVLALCCWRVFAILYNPAAAFSSLFSDLLWLSLSHWHWYINCTADQCNNSFQTPHWFLFQIKFCSYLFTFKFTFCSVFHAVRFRVVDIFSQGFRWWLDGEEISATILHSRWTPTEIRRRQMEKNGPFHGHKQHQCWQLFAKRGGRRLASNYQDRTLLSGAGIYVL